MTLIPPAKAYIRNLLLGAFVGEADDQVRRKVGDSIAEVARQLADVGQCSPSQPPLRALESMWWRGEFSCMR